MYGIRQGLSEARNLTGQSLQDDDAIQEYNHANHLEYLKQVSDATDKLKKKDASDEDTTLEIDAGKAAISMHGVYGARNTALDMQEKVGKYLDKLKESGQDAEDLKKAFSEGGGVSGLVKKAFVSGVDKLKKKAKDSIDEVSDTAKETYNSISQESQDAAADFSNLGQDTAESVRPNTRTPTADVPQPDELPTDSVAPQSPPSEPIISEPVDEQPSVSSSLLDEQDVDDDEPTTQTGDVPQPDEVPLGDVPNRIRQTGRRPPPRRSRMTPQPDEMEGIRVQSPQRRPDEQAPELEEPDDRFEGGDLFDDDPSELRSLPSSRPTGVVRDIGPGDDDDDEEQERMEQEFEKTRNESVEAQTNRFTEGLKAPIKQTKSRIYPKEAFLTRDDSQVADFMDSDKSIESMMKSVDQHTQLYGDDFNFRRKFDSNTRFVQDEFWPKDQAAPDLLPDDKVFHAGSIENGKINMSEGSQAGKEGIVGDSKLVDKEPIAREPIAREPLAIADGTTRTAVPVSDRPPVLESQMPDIDEPPIQSRAPPSNRLQIGDKRPEDPQVDLPDSEPELDLPDPEPEPDLPDTRSARQRFIEQGDTEAPEPVFTDTPPPQQPPPPQQSPREPTPSEPTPSEPPPQQATPKPTTDEPIKSDTGPKPKLSSEDLRQGMEDAFKNPAEEGASRIGQVFGKTAGRVGKVVAKFGDIASTGLNAAMAIDQTYNEGKDIFSKHPHLEGDDGWQKAGNLVGMLGEDVTLAGGITRFAGPEGAVIGTGLELAGGVVGLIGSGLSDIGDFFEGEKKKKTAAQQAQQSVYKPPVIQQEAIQAIPGGLINQAQSSLKQLN
tara:strand:- start:783 stop:3275 length:2493 start_codon:yes stop_codon:yes gene_type:complete